MQHVKYHFLVLLASTLVAGSFLASKELAEVANPVSLTLLRFVGASLILAPLICFKAQWRRKVGPTMPRALIISFFYAAFFIGFFKSLHTTTSLNTGALFTLVPFATALISVVVFRERITKTQMIVYLLGAVGTCWVVFSGEIALFLSFSLNEGDFIFLFALLFMCLYTIAMKFFYKDDEMIVLVFCTLVGGALWMLLALLVTGQGLEWGSIKNDAVFHMAYLILGATLATVYLYQIATVALGPSRVNAYIYLNPALVAMLLLIFNGTGIPVAVLPGIFISVAATFILQLGNRGVPSKN